MHRVAAPLKNAGAIIGTVVLVLLFWTGLYFLSELGQPLGTCAPYATYDHCGEATAPGPGGR